MNKELLGLIKLNKSRINASGFEVFIQTTDHQTSNPCCAVDIKSKSKWAEITAWKNMQVYFCIFDEEVGDMISEENLEIATSSEFTGLFLAILEKLNVP